MANPNINPLVHREQNGVQVTSKSIDFGDTAAQTIGIFPAGTVFESVTVVTTTAFTGGTATTLDVGIDSNSDSLVDGENIRSAGTVSATVIDAGRYLSASDTLVCLVATDDTAGAATVVVKWTAI